MRSRQGARPPHTPAEESQAGVAAGAAGGGRLKAADRAQRAPAHSSAGRLPSLQVPKALRSEKLNPPISQAEAAEMDFEFQKRAETLLAVDDQVAAVVRVRSPGLLRDLSKLDA